jgi:hypothetical protein
VLRVRHQTEDVSVHVHHTCNVPFRAVRVLAPRVAKDDLLVLEVGGRVVATFAVLHGNGQLLPGFAPGREGGVRTLDADRHVCAHELERRVGAQHARKEAGLAKDLEAVADPEDEPALGCEGAHRPHRRGEPGDRPAAEVVPVGETSREDDCVDLGQLPLRVPDEARLGAERSQSPGGVAVVVRPRKDEDGDLRSDLAHSPTSIS